MTANQIQYSEWDLGVGMGTQGGQVMPLPPLPITDVLSPNGQHLCRMEHYVNEGPEEYHALLQFQNRMQLLRADRANYRTIVVDSYTSLEAAAVRYQQFFTPRTNQGNVDPRKWYANAKDNVLQEVIGRLAWLRTESALLLCHASEDAYEFGDTVVRGIQSIGKSPNALGACFGEIYHAMVVDEKDQTGKILGKKHILQTHRDGKWGAMTLIGAPDGCEPVWDRLWDGGAQPRPLRCIVYGAFGTGKSKFAATWPTPILVLAFDPYDKMVHYEQIQERG